MKVSVGFPNRGHAYRVALHFAKRNMLGQGFSFQPKWRLDPVVRSCTSTLTSAALLQRVCDAATFGKVHGYSQAFANEALDNYIAGLLQPCDIFMAMSEVGLNARRVARRLGAIAVCDRGCSHMEFQDQVLRDEFGRLGLGYQGIPARTIRRQLREYHEADVIVVQSSFAHRTFVDKGIPADKIELLPPGVDTEHITPALRAPDDFTVGFIGQIGARKGIHHLLAAIGDLHGKGLRIALAGSLMPEATTLLAPYADCFTYEGVLNRSNVVGFLHRLSLLVLPSIEDGFGLVINEALAAGVPVIASTQSGGPDVIRHGVDGFVVPAGNPAAIRERVLTLLESPTTFAEMRSSALSHSRRFASWETFGEQVEAMYSRRLADRARAS